MEFPYQLTTFIGSKPAAGEPVYNGVNGWYPQIALKRRFKLVGIGEDEFIAMLQGYCQSTPSFTVHTGSLIKPGRMPVKVIEVEQSHELMDFHTKFIATMGGTVQSRYPERDGVNYLPHITAEYDGKMVIDPHQFINRIFLVKSIWLLKDIFDEDSQAFREFNLTQ